jgi:hypothetical protein
MESTVTASHWGSFLLLLGCLLRDQVGTLANLNPVQAVCHFLEVN